jgi:PPE-repeat protein
MLDFAALPPEINSALMYSGSGSGSLQAAAVAWNELATELRTVAAAYQSVVAGLMGGPWQGLAASSMAHATRAQVGWLNDAAAQAEQAATQAAAAARSYEAAFAATVPPPVIAANRALLMQLLATNVLGQNTPAIAATEAHYAEMWAQDAAAMYGYAGAATAASTLTPFIPPATTTNPAGLAGQAAAVSQAVGTSADSTQTLSQFTSAVPGVLASLAGSTSTPPWLAGLGLTLEPSGSGVIVGGVLGDMLAGISGSSTLNAATPFNAFARQISNVRLFATAFRDIEGLSSKALETMGKSAKATGEAAANAASTLPANIVPAAAGPGLAGGLGGATGSVGKAASIGVLSVPNSWAAAAPASSSAPTTLAGSTWTAASQHSGSVVPAPGMPGVASATRNAAGFAAPRYGVKLTVMAQPPAGG